MKRSVYVPLAASAVGALLIGAVALRVAWMHRARVLAATCACAVPILVSACGSSAPAPLLPARGTATTHPAALTEAGALDAFNSDDNATARVANAVALMDKLGLRAECYIGVSPTNPAAIEMSTWLFMKGSRATFTGTDGNVHWTGTSITTAPSGGDTCYLNTDGTVTLQPEGN